MVRTSLTLIRHGHVADNDAGAGARLCGWLDPPLSDRGRAEVQYLRQRLATEGEFSAVYSSPLRRARDTALALAERLGLRTVALDALREIHCGQLDGLLLSEVKRRYPELWQRNLARTDERFCWPGGESYRELRARALGAVSRIAASHPGQRVAIVTHAGIISQVLGALAGTSAARWDLYRAGNASISQLLWRGETGLLVRFDDRHHLQLAAPAGVGAPNDAQAVLSGAGA